MKRTMFSLFWVALALVWWDGVPPSLAYSPPCPAVTGPTVAQDANTTVTVSVHNPATGQDIPYVWSIAGGAAVIAVDQLYNVQGMSAWRVKDLTNNQYKVVYGVYDPVWATEGHPESGWQFRESSPWTALDTQIIAVNDGIVLYECKSVSGSDGSDTYVIDYFEAYDPGWFPDIFGVMPIGWRELSYSMTSYTGGMTSSHIVKDGVVAYIYSDPGYWGYSMVYAIYDGRNYGWRYNTDYPTNPPTPPQINAATVTWTEDSVPQKRGYDYTSYSWQAGVDTKVMSYFAWGPINNKSNRPTWFTDMSIAANNWSWSLGDGGVTDARSFYHNYSKPGHYLVNQNVLGPAGSDSFSQTVTLQTPATGALMLLLSGD